MSICIKHFYFPTNFLKSVLVDLDHILTDGFHKFEALDLKTGKFNSIQKILRKILQHSVP